MQFKDRIGIPVEFEVTLLKSHFQVSSDDMVKILEGPLKGKQATVLHVHRGFLFARCREVGAPSRPPLYHPACRGNTVRSFPTHGQLSAAQGSSTTVSARRPFNITF